MTFPNSYESIVDRTPGGRAGSLWGPSKKYSEHKKRSEMKRDDKIKQLEAENKQLRKDIELMIQYAPGSEKYNTAKNHFETLQKI